MTLTSLNDGATCCCLCRPPSAGESSGLPADDDLAAAAAAAFSSTSLAPSRGGGGGDLDMPLSGDTGDREGVSSSEALELRDEHDSQNQELS